MSSESDRSRLTPDAAPAWLKPLVDNAHAVKKAYRRRVPAVFVGSTIWRQELDPVALPRPVLRAEASIGLMRDLAKRRIDLL